MNAWKSACGKIAEQYSDGIMIPRSLTSLSSAVLVAVSFSFAQAQDLLQHGALDAFRATSHWQGVAEVSAVPEQMKIEAKGTGKILLNSTAKDLKVPYLMTKAEYGDLHVEMEFLIPKGSNAGVYLMGRYEVQIFDSFGLTELHYDDLGGIYQSWDPSLPQKQEGFAGTPPKVNATKAPGEWQTLDITFRAPRLDAAGKKIADPVFEKVLVNGILVQENVSVPGPTRSSPLSTDAATGPLTIQGDHGPIAIRKLRVTSLAETDVTRRKELDAYWAEVSRAVNTGDFPAYAATCHADGILVSGTKQMSQPLSTALARWKSEFDLTREGKTKNSVAFRFHNRIGDATTAHETGIFRYSVQNPGEAEKVEFVQFEALLLKQNSTWKIVMENQQRAVSEADWKALEGK